MAEHALAVLVDFENMARPGAKSRGDFDIHLVLDRLNEKGRVIVKRAYADWSRYREAKHQLQNAGLELIEMPSAREGAKNRADIKLAVDAMELAYSREHVDNFVIVSGDSDFTPLVGKLRELNKRVIGVGNRDSTSELLVANCDEFIYYDSIAGGSGGAPRADVSKRGPKDVTQLLQETLTALQREGVEWGLASIVKDSMRRKKPAFDEREAGFSTFSKLLEDAAARGIVRLETDPRSGTYRVELADSTARVPDMSGPVASAPADERADADGGRRRRRRRPRVGENDVEASDQNGLGDVPEGSEVFELVVSTTPDEGLGELPPVGEPISYEDMILLGPEIDADVPELVEASDLDRIVAEQPSRGSRRRRRRFSTDSEPTAADLDDLREDSDTTVDAPFAIEPIDAGAIRLAFESGEVVRFTVEGVVHDSADTLGTASVEDGVVVRSYATADGAVERRLSKTLEAGVKFLAAGRKGAFRAVRVVTPESPTGGGEAEAAPTTDGRAEDASRPESPGRRRRRTLPQEATDATAPDADAPEPAPGAPRPARRRRGTVSAEAPATPAASTADQAPSDAAATSGGRRRRRTSPPSD